MEQQNKMGTAQMGPLIFSMALPAMISMIINALYNIVDSIFVAKYSQDALAAVSLVYPLQMLVVAIGVGTGVGVNSLIARRLGEKRQKHADSAAEHGVALAVVGGIAFFILGWGFSGVFVGAFGASEAVSAYAIQYSHLAVGMSIFVMISMMCEKIQQSGGNMIIPMCQGLTGAIINIILDPLMIFGIGPFPEMGIRGAALATVIGQIFGMALGLWGVFRQQKVLNVNMREFKWRGQTIKDIYRVGLPGIVMQSVVSVMTAGMNGILIAFSQTAVNVLGVYFKLQTFLYLPASGIVQGMRPILSFNYGAGEKKADEADSVRVYRTDLWDPDGRYGVVFAASGTDHGYVFQGQCNDPGRGSCTSDHQPRLCGFRNQRCDFRCTGGPWGGNFILYHLPAALSGAYCAGCFYWKQNVRYYRCLGCVPGSRSADCGCRSRNF